MGNSDSSESKFGLRILSLSKESPCQQLIPFLDIIVDAHTLEFDVHEFNISYFLSIVDSSDGHDILLSVFSLDKRRIKTIRVTPVIIGGKYSVGIRVRPETIDQALRTIFKVNRVFEGGIGKKLGLKEEDWVIGVEEFSMSSLDDFCNKIGKIPLSVAFFNEAIKKVRIVEIPICKFLGCEFAAGSINSFKPNFEENFLFCEDLIEDDILDLNAIDDDQERRKSMSFELNTNTLDISLLLNNTFPFISQNHFQSQKQELNQEFKVQENSQLSNSQENNEITTEFSNLKKRDSGRNTCVMNFKGKLKFDFNVLIPNNLKSKNSFKTLTSLRNSNLDSEVENENISFDRISEDRHQSGSRLVENPQSDLTSKDLNLSSILDEINNSMTEKEQDLTTVYCSKIKRNYQIDSSDLFLL